MIEGIVDKKYTCRGDLTAELVSCQIGVAVKLLNAADVDLLLFVEELLVLLLRLDERFLEKVRVCKN